MFACPGHAGSQRSVSQWPVPLKFDIHFCRASRAGFAPSSGSAQVDGGLAHLGFASIHTNPSRFGMRTFGSVTAFISSRSPITFSAASK